MSNGIIWNEKKLIYLFIPKNGCTSLKKVFADGQGLTYHTPHDAAFQKCTPAMARAMEGYHTFAVVRNPMARLVSLYRDKIRPGYRGWGFRAGVEEFVLAPYGIFHKEMSFPEFANRCLDISLANANEHWKPQARQIRAGKWLPETVIRFEEYAEAVPAFLARFGIEIELPRLNPSWRPDARPWQELYTPELMEKAKQYYAEDIRLWYSN